MTAIAEAGLTATWRLALISSGEISVEEKLKEANQTQKAGHEVRLIDIEAVCGTYGVFDNLHGSATGCAFSEELKQAAGQFHGEVGRAFVEFLIRHQAKFGPTIARTVKGIQAKALSTISGPISGQMQRVANRFAAIGVAGELARQAGLTGWDSGSAMNAAIAAFRDWYDRKHGEKHDTAAEFVAPLKAFIAANVNGFCTVGGPVPAGGAVGWKDANRYYLPPETWSLIHPGLSGTEAARALIEINLLYHADGKHLMKKAPRGIEGRPRLYTLNIENLAQFAAR